MGKIRIAKYVTWPRIKCSIKGQDVTGNPLEGDYTTYKTSTEEKDRNIVQIGFVSEISSLKIGEKKNLFQFCLIRNYLRHSCLESRNT